MSIKKAIEGQNIFDVIVKEFGTLENISSFLNDNLNLSINTDLNSGDSVNINALNLGDEDVKSFFIKRNFTTNNKDLNFVNDVRQFFQLQGGVVFNFQGLIPYKFN